MRIGKKILISVLAVFYVLLSSCLPDTELAPDPVEGTIVRFKIVNMPDAIVAISGKNILVTLPIGSSVTALVPDIIISKGATPGNYTPGQVMDFSNEVLIQVKGTNTVVTEYLVKVQVKEPQPGFKTPELLFEKKHSDLGWPLHNVFSTAVSKENLLIMIAGKIEKFNPYSGERTGTMTLPAAVSINQISNDSQGKIIAITVSNGGAVAKFFKWDDVNSAPQELAQWTVDIAGSQIVGRTVLNVNGDITKNAVIYTAANLSPYVLRWTIKNGAFVSQSPEKILYVSPTGETNFPNTNPSVNALGSNPENGFTVTVYNRGYSYVGPDKIRIFKTSEAQGPIRSFVFDFNRAKYFAGSLYASSMFIFDITNPDGIEMSEAQRFENGIDFKPFTSPAFPQNAGAANITASAGFSIKYNADGTAILYYVFANSGIRAYKLTPKQ
jgi:hypothetical protein